MKRKRTISRGFTQWKRADSPTGYEYWHMPSIRARRIWNYALSIGEARWPVGFRHAHPNPQSAPGEVEGYLLHFVLDGELRHRVRNQTVLASRNDAVLVRMADGVEYRNERAKTAHFYWVTFNGKQMGEIFADLAADTDPLFRALDRARVTGIFRELIRIIAREPRGYEAEGAGLLWNLLAKLYAVRAQEVPLPATRTDLAKTSEPVRHAIRSLTRFYTHPLTVKELSNEAGVSVSYFQRLFRRETGYTPIQYLNHYRIEQAKVLLAGTRDNVESIAHQVGISDEAYFSRLFRQLNGISPRECRQRSAR